mmetsp:Transcript_71752/g.149820  ORF Transcript_71752/g.149820 Transcript_71752/m.149820 type:complete len:87 (-) Transcript_71752:52-312(-)
MRRQDNTSAQDVKHEDETPGRNFQQRESAASRAMGRSQQHAAPRQHGGVWHGGVWHVTCCCCCRVTCHVLLLLSCDMSRASANAAV